MSKQLICMISTEGKTPEQISNELAQSLTKFQATKLGLKRCKKCGEYCGAAIDNGSAVLVECLCAGIDCTNCRTTKIHRPISNYFNESNNKITHVPYFYHICSGCNKIH